MQLQDSLVKEENPVDFLDYTYSNFFKILKEYKESLYLQRKASMLSEFYF